MEAAGGGVRYARRSEVQWRELMVDLEQSGLSHAAFCRSRGVAPSSLGNWLRKLRGEARSDRASRNAPAAGFIELRPSAAADVAPLAWDVELTLGDGIALRLRCARC